MPKYIYEWQDSLHIKIQSYQATHQHRHTSHKNSQTRDVCCDNVNKLMLSTRRREPIQKLHKNKPDNAMDTIKSINNLSNYNKKQHATLYSIIISLRIPNQWISITVPKPLA